MSSNRLARMSSILLAAVIALSPLKVHAADETRWVFPGSALPADIPYAPLRADSNPGSDVGVQSRDWFLLKANNNLIGGSAAFTGLNGPQLNATNAQVYFRLVSGMILKETLIQQIPEKQQLQAQAQARAIVDNVTRSGKTLDAAAIDDLGELPPLVSEMYRLWESPMAKLQFLPAIVLPLSVANNDSSFQHFFAAPVVNETTDKKCSTITTAQPVAPIQKRINERKDQLATLVQLQVEAQDEFDKSNIRTTQLSTSSGSMQNSLQSRDACLNSIRDRVAKKSSPMPTPSCLAAAKELLEKDGLGNEWSTFVSAHLSKEEGDFAARASMQARIDVAESDINQAKIQLQNITARKLQATNDLSTNREKLSKLLSQQTVQANAEAALDNQEKTLREERQKIVDVVYKFESGSLSPAEVEEYKKQSKNMTIRKEQINKQLPLIVAKKAEHKNSKDGFKTQIDYLNDQITNNETQIRSMEEEEPKAQAVVKQREATRAALNTEYVKVTDAALFSEKILLAFQTSNTRLKDDLTKELTELRKEQENNEKKKEALGRANKELETNQKPLEGEIASLEGQLTFYKNEQNMGWFLEQDCPSREQLESEKNGVFLSRNIIRAVANPRFDGAPVEGGKWGMFNLDYSVYSKEIKSGIVLNMPDYIRFATQHLKADLSAAVTRYADAQAEQCTAGARLPLATVDIMGNAYASWNDGSTDAARAKLYCRSVEKAAYTSALTSLLNFSGTVLDQALPRTNGESLERDTIISALTELRILVGLTAKDSVEASNARRDKFIKSLVRILAFDYPKAVSDSQNLLAKQNIRMASAAPGRVATPANLSAIKTGDTLSVQEPVRLYRVPINKTEFASPLSLKLNDQVTILAVDKAEATGGNWVHVQIAGQTVDYWMPASALFAPERPAPTIKGTPNKNPQDGGNIGATNLPLGSTECPLRRLVDFIRGSEIPRYLAPIALTRYQGDAFYRIDPSNNKQAKPNVSKEKKYVACELFEETGKPAMTGPKVSQATNEAGFDMGKIIGVRIVEVQANANGEYRPVEDYGGFITTWIFVPLRTQGVDLYGMPTVRVRLEPSARVKLGKQLDEQWRIIQ